MIARRTLPAEFSAWNRRWGAPWGKPLAQVPPFTHPKARWAFPQAVGLFAFQDNNSTRLYEYPWAFHAVPLAPGVDVLELGGSLSGFQFALCKSGARVVNVDPGSEATGKGWPVNQTSLDRLNRAFRTDVQLRNTTLTQAGVESASIDIVYSISTIEHIPSDELPDLMRAVHRVLRPGGHCVLTIDLFLDLAPFSERPSNRFGINIDVRWLLEQAEFDLVVGDPAELFGFDAFNERAVLGQLDEYLLGSYPALAQCVVLRKPT